MRFRIDDAVAARYGISRVDVAQAIYGRTRGMPVGELYVGEDPIPVVIRSALGERLAVSDLEAVDVPTLNGKHTLEIPAGTQHGAVLQVKAEGLPNIRSGRRGALLVQVLVEIPKKLNKQQEKLLREFAQTEDKSVMPESKGFFERLKAHFSEKK